MSIKNFNCQELKWDSEYFGMKCARVSLSGCLDSDTQKEVLDICNNFEFVTISNINNDNSNNIWIGTNTTAFLADVNIQFHKNLTNESMPVDLSTGIYNNYPLNEQIVTIARQAFKYSRFINDPNLPLNQAKGIYVHWLESAFGLDDKYFVICERGGLCAGFILFSLQDGKGIIELIAVDQKFQGQKVGRSMIAAVQSFMIKNGITKLNVGTQINNISAIQFYNKMGFEYSSCTSVYHMWN